MATTPRPLLLLIAQLAKFTSKQEMHDRLEAVCYVSWKVFTQFTCRTMNHNCTVAIPYVLSLTVMLKVDACKAHIARFDIDSRRVDF